MNLSVLMNTIILSLDGTVPKEDTLDLFNFSFTIIFIIEMGLKIIAMGIADYLRDKMNAFDAIIVILSIIELIFLGEGGGSAISAFRTVRIFRLFRVLRVTKLMRYKYLFLISLKRTLSFMNFIISVISSALQSFIYIFLILILFIYVFALLGRKS